MWKAIKQIGEYIKYLPPLLEAIDLMRKEGEDIWKEVKDLRRELKQARKELQKIRRDLPPSP